LAPHDLVCGQAAGRVGSQGRDRLVDVADVPVCGRLGVAVLFGHDLFSIPSKKETLGHGTGWSGA
jgi:hypothetical protein